MASNVAFKQLYLSYYGRVRTLLIRLGSPPYEVEELTQDTFLRVYRAVERGQTISGAYIAGAARSVLYNRIRREKDPIKRGSGEGVDAAEAASQSPGPEAQALRKELTRACRKAFEQLSPRQQHCLLLFAQGYKYREIARLIGIGEETVRTHLRDGRGRLRETLKDEGLP